MNGTTTPLVVQSPQYSLPSAPGLFRWAFSFYAKHWQVIIGILLAPLILGIIQVVLKGNVAIGLSLLVIGFLSQLALLAAVTEEGQPVGGILGAYRKGVRMLIPFIWVNVLVTLANLGGYLLLLVPGLLLSIYFSLSLYVLFAENRGGLSALVTSWYYVKGYWLSVLWRFLFFGLAFLFIILVMGFVTAGPTFFSMFKAGGAVKPEVPLWSQIFNLFFNNLFFIPLSVIYSYGIYRALRQIKATVPVEQEEQKLKKAVIIFLIIGIIGLVFIIAFIGFVLVKFFPQSYFTTTLDFLSFAN